jgi:hypothetical protein
MLPAAAPADPESELANLDVRRADGCYSTNNYGTSVVGKWIIDVIEWDRTVAHHDMGGWEKRR